METPFSEEPKGDVQFLCASVSPRVVWCPDGGEGVSGVWRQPPLSRERKCLGSQGFPLPQMSPRYKGTLWVFDSDSEA